jgi:hypothetical protein
MCRLRSVALVVAVLLAGCRIEDRTPAGTRRDDDAIRSVLATYYQSLGQRDWSRSRALFWDSATVELRHVAPDTAWRDFRTADAYHQYLARTYAGFLGITIINPMTVAYFAALVLGLPAVQGGLADRLAFAVAAFLASASWQLLLAAAGALLHRHASPGARRWTTVAGNLVILAFAARIALDLIA